MRARWIILAIGTVIAVLAGLVVVYNNFIWDRDAQPYCHKQILGAFNCWMGEQGMDINKHTNAFPNVRGSSTLSLLAIGDYTGSMDWAKMYRYVPGLRENDRGDLVLMYLDRPTRWVWHGQTPTIFESKAWILVPVDFKMGREHLAGRGELSERVSLEEFRSRLQRTLDFVRTNERPNWRSVVAEHTEFLNSIPR